MQSPHARRISSTRRRWLKALGALPFGLFLLIFAIDLAGAQRATVQGVGDVGILIYLLTSVIAAPLVTVDAWQRGMRATCLFWGGVTLILCALALPLYLLASAEDAT
jgi:hypothetical protein